MTMRSRLQRRLVSVALTMLVGGCASTHVEVARSPEADFDRYATFSFFQPLGTDREKGTGTILSQTLKRAARADLEGRGYRYLTEGGDLQVNFFVETKEMLEGRSPSVGVSYGIFHRRYGVWTDYDTELHQYTVGTLHVDVVDVRTDQLAWEGVAQARQPDTGFVFDPKKVQEAVERVFAKFPRRSPAAGS